MPMMPQAVTFLNRLVQPTLINTANHVEKVNNYVVILTVKLIWIRFILYIK
jgi:hypothetical protein